MFEIFRLCIAIAASAIAGLYDLKTSDIPNMLILFIFVSASFFFILEGALGNWEIFKLTLIYFALFSVFALALYYSGAWGAGDSAMLVGMVYLLPANFFPFVYFISIFLVGFFYSLSYMLILLLKNKKARKRFLNKFKQYKILYLILFPAWGATAYMQNVLLFLLFNLLLLAPIVFSLSNCSKILFYRRVRTSALKPGDVLAESVIGLDAKRIRGLTQKQIKMLRRTRRYVLIRDGIRYGPVFFFSLFFALQFIVFK